jgi:hypothetical protein
VQNELNYSILESFMPQTPSDMVRALVLRELEEGKRHDGLWLQAMSESQLNPEKAKQRYIELRTKAMQSDMKNLLIQQIRGAVASRQ